MNILIRITGEIVLKSGPVSKRFQKQLLKNLKSALKTEGIVCHLQGQWARLWVETEDPRIVEILPRIFGVHAFSLIEHECPAKLETIVEEGARFYKQQILGKTFAVKTHRIGKHEYSSKDVNYDLGAALNVDNEKSMVDLTRPQVTVNVEIRDGRAYFFRETIKACGGLPLGTAGHCLSLISGGFDSSVASWMMQKRGLNLSYLFCNLAGESNERAVLKVMMQLTQRWSYGDRPLIHIVDFQPVVAEILAKVKAPFSQIILKRLFYRIAEKLAQQCGAQGLITGEAISQVSSQTLANLAAISDAVDMPIYRPLIATDKIDIINLSRQIGVYESAALIREYCQIVPEKPVVACPILRAQEEESYIDLSILDKQLASRKTIDLFSLRPTDLLGTYVFKDSIPEGAVVIDCQDEIAYQNRHEPRADHWDYYDLLKGYRSFAKDSVYLIYCTFGLQSALIAEKMQNDGYQAYSLQGGVKSLAF